MDAFEKHIHVIHLHFYPNYRNLIELAACAFIDIWILNASMGIYKWILETDVFIKSNEYICPLVLLNIHCIKVLLIKITNK